MECAGEVIGEARLFRRCEEPLVLLSKAHGAIDVGVGTCAENRDCAGIAACCDESVVMI